VQAGAWATRAAHALDDTDAVRAIEAARACFAEARSQGDWSGIADEIRFYAGVNETGAVRQLLDVAVEAVGSGAIDPSWTVAATALDVGAYDDAARLAAAAVASSAEDASVVELRVSDFVRRLSSLSLDAASELVASHVQLRESRTAEGAFASAAEAAAYRAETARQCLAHAERIARDADRRATEAFVSRGELVADPGLVDQTRREIAAWTAFAAAQIDAGTWHYEPIEAARVRAAARRSLISGDGYADSRSAGTPAELLVELVERAAGAALPEDAERHLAMADEIRRDLGLDDRERADSLFLEVLARNVDDGCTAGTPVWHVVRDAMERSVPGLHVDSAAAAARAKVVLRPEVRARASTGALPSVEEIVGDAAAQLVARRIEPADFRSIALAAADEQSVAVVQSAIVDAMHAGSPVDDDPERTYAATLVTLATISEVQLRSPEIGTDAVSTKSEAVARWGAAAALAGAPGASSIVEEVLLDEQPEVPVDARAATHALEELYRDAGCPIPGFPGITMVCTLLAQHAQRTGDDPGPYADMTTTLAYELLSDRWDARRAGPLGRDDSVAGGLELASTCSVVVSSLAETDPAGAAALAHEYVMPVLDEHRAMRSLCAPDPAAARAIALGHAHAWATGRVVDSTRSPDLGDPTVAAVVSQAVGCSPALHDLEVPKPPASAMPATISDLLADLTDGGAPEARPSLEPPTPDTCQPSNIDDLDVEADGTRLPGEEDRSDLRRGWLALPETERTPDDLDSGTDRPDIDIW